MSVMGNGSTTDKSKAIEGIAHFEKGEKCSNPWRQDCGKTDIVLYIFYQGKQVPICHGCWNSISSIDTEWVYD